MQLQKRLQTQKNEARTPHSLNMGPQVRRQPFPLLPLTTKSVCVCIKWKGIQQQSHKMGVTWHVQVWLPTQSLRA